MSTENEKNNIIIAISQGDINGIGFEVILKTFQDPRIIELFTPVIYGSPKVAAYYKKVLKLNTNINIIKDINSISYNKLNIINCNDENVRVEIGKSTKYAGVAAYESLKTAVNDMKNNKMKIIVTAPINKHNIQIDDFHFPGHTEFFANEFNIKTVLMLMIHQNLRVAVVTGHLPINDVSKTITKELILTKLQLLNDSLKQDFAIRKPVIAVLGLNPHSGDKGVIGNEEIETIIPAIEEANQKGIVALGPYPSDSFFHSSNFEKFDAVLAMYHDQGLIPFKLIADGNGVNYTAGLPVVRTSPAHGTAYDIVGKNTASYESFKEAVYVALDIYKNRKMLTNINPLEKQQFSEN
jgi:4-hydroxythreonine-4-phosphate dehydrogenase